MKKASWCIFALLSLALLSGCSGRFPNANRTLFGVTGYGITLELLSSSASAPPSGVESEVNVGKHASYAKRGSAAMFGLVAPPAAGAFTVTPTSATTADMTRVAAVPGEATGWGRLLRANDGSFISESSAAITSTTTSQAGLLAATTYRYHFAWFKGNQRISDWGPQVVATQP